MPDQYHMDLEKFTLDRLRRICQASKLMPSESILAEEIPERFAILESMGIGNLRDLRSALSTKSKIQDYSQESGLPQDYLIILRRRAGIYTPRPVPLTKLPGVKPKQIESLAAVEIKDSRQLFGRVKSEQDRVELSGLVDVPGEVVLELTKLSDLVRAPFVGPVYARLFYKAGSDTLEKLSSSQPEELLARMHAVNEEQKLTRAALSLSVAEMESFLEIVEMIPKVIEY